MIEYTARVVKLAEVKYGIEECVLEAYWKTIEECYKYNYTPRRAVELIAEHLYK